MDERLLKPRNQFRLLEIPLIHNYSRSVVILRASKNYHRFLHVGLDCTFDSCVLIDGSKVLIGVYTLPKVRRQRLAKQLLAVAKLHLKAVYYDGNFSELGRAWINSVEGLPKTT